MDRTLSSEVWILIASHLPLRSRSVLSRVSRYLLSSTRPSVFVEVKLGGYGMRYRSTQTEDYTNTLLLLKSNTTLASRVQSFEIHHTLPVALIVGALVNMTSLKALTVWRPIFETKVQQSRYMDTIKQNGVTIGSLRVLTNTFPGDDAFFPGLKLLDWSMEYGGINSPRVGTALKNIWLSATETLTSINIPIGVNGIVPTQMEFWDTRFPKLSYLKLNFWHNSIFDMPPSVEQFFLYHSKTLQRVEGDFLESVFCALSFGTVVGTNGSTPKLVFREIQGPPEFLSSATSVYADRFWNSIEKIDLIPFREEDTNAYTLECLNGFISFLNESESVSPIQAPQLVALNLLPVGANDPDDWRSIKPRNMLPYIRRVREVFGETLETFGGFLPPKVGLKAEKLGAELAKFRRLRQVNVFEWGLGDVVDAFVLTLAKKCKTLETTVVLEFEEDKNATSFSIVRLDGSVQLSERFAIRIPSQSPFQWD